MKRAITAIALLVLPTLTVSFTTPHPRRVDTISTLLAAEVSNDNNNDGNFLKTLKAPLLSTLLAGCVAVAPALAVSGGGLDFAGLDISGQDFSKQSYKGKDFTQVLAKKTTFAGSNLQGCRFYKAYLVQTDFTGADMRGASFEDTSMDEADLKGANAAGAYFSRSILDVKNLENIDLTDAQVPVKALPLLCDREDLKGTNPVTGADTRESIMCP